MIRIQPLDFGVKPEIQRVCSVHVSRNWETTSRGEPREQMAMLLKNSMICVYE